METRKRQKSKPQNTETTIQYDIKKQNKPPAPFVVCFIGFIITMLFLFWIIITSMVISFAFTDSYTWGYELNDIKHLPIISVFYPPIIFKSEEELLKYNGENKELPIYLTVKGYVFDVSSGSKFYGPSGGYHIFAGRDASRSFATGCFNPEIGSKCLENAKNGLEGLDEKQLAEIDNWLDFYQTSKEYPFVGYFPSSPSAGDELKQYI